jgi:hypothetical protein
MIYHGMVHGEPNVFVTGAIKIQVGNTEIGLVIFYMDRFTTKLQPIFRELLENTQFLTHKFI